MPTIKAQQRFAVPGIKNSSFGQLKSGFANRIIKTEQNKGIVSFMISERCKMIENSLKNKVYTFAYSGTMSTN